MDGLSIYSKHDPVSISFDQLLSKSTDGSCPLREIHFESTDFRKPQQTISRPRSINLAFSQRGIEAIRAVDPEMVERLLKQVTPMKARMIHSIDGGLNSQPYGLHEEVSEKVKLLIQNRSF